MIITLAGTPGSGKSTIAKLLEEKLGMKHYYMGAVMRDIARKRGITLNELDVLRKQGPEIDNEVDEYTIGLGKSKEDIIVDSRTAAHFIPHARKIFMRCTPECGAGRILKDINEKGQGEARNEKSANSVEEQTALIKQRMADEQKIYRDLYGFDLYDMSNYDFVIDTTELTIEQVLGNVLDFLGKK